MAITSQQVAELRAKTGVGILDCKKALEEAGGNIDKAVEILRKKGTAKAAKRADKIAAEGKIVSYIHAGGRIGVLLELNCETDFVARNEKFNELAVDLAMHIAAMNPKYLNREDVSEVEINKEKEVYIEQLKNEGKPADIIDKIVQGKLEKFFTENCLLDQTYIKDETKTIKQLLVEATAEIGEKISLRRFIRYEVGEGIEKKATDFVAEVQEQMN